MSQVNYVVLTEAESDRMSRSLYKWAKALEEGKIDNLAITKDLTRFLREVAQELGNAPIDEVSL